MSGDLTQKPGAFRQDSIQGAYESMNEDTFNPPNMTFTTIDAGTPIKKISNMLRTKHGVDFDQIQKAEIKGKNVTQFMFKSKGKTVAVFMTGEGSKNKPNLGYQGK